MIPILFESDAKFPQDFMLDDNREMPNHGIGDLIDCIECKTHQNEDGEYELSFSYPMDGPLLNELTIGRIIYARANRWNQNQMFRIYGYEKVIAGTITVNCQHISYDLANIPVKAFKANKDDDAKAVMDKWYSNALEINWNGINKTVLYHNYESDITDKAQTQKGYFQVETPTNMRAALLDGDESIKGCFGGDLIFNNHYVALKKVGGEYRNVVIEYGVDLIDLQQEENISEMYTGVFPYFTYNGNDNEQKIAYGSVQYVTGASAFKTQRVFPLDLTSYFPNQADHSAPTAEELDVKAREWMAKEDNFGKPEISLTINYASLGQDVRLYDEVTVRFPKLGIDVKTKVCGYTYDVLNERMVEIEVGKTKPSAIFSLEDASRLRKGLMPPERIKNNSIGGGKIQGGGVSSYHLKDGAASKGKVGPKAVDTPELEDEAVTYEKSEYQDTLDQVAINEADILTIKSMFVSQLEANWIQCFSLNATGYLSLQNAAVATRVWCYDTFEQKGS